MGGIYRGIGGTGESTSDANYAAVQAKAVEAAASAASALASKTAAETAETNAETAKTNAESAATTATSAATTATTAATSATTSATSASDSATSASASATSAATSESNASTSASTAITKASEASTSATNAAASATSATSSASSASTSSSTATTKASEASTSATNAAASATSAASSATSAAASATSAAASATSAAASFDSFDDRYLGAKSSDPAVDNDGNALISGALYWNTTVSEMRVWNGSSWSFIGVSSSAGVNSFNSRGGDVTLTSSDVTTALGYTPQTQDTQLTDIAGLTPTDNAFIVGNGTNFVVESGATARTSLGLGTAATTNSADYATAAQGTAADTAYADRLKWDGGATGLTASTGRTSLGLGTAATTDATDYATAAQGAAADSAYADRLKWDGGATGLTAATGRASLGLGTAATTNATDYATAAQGAKADSALQSTDIGVSVQAYDVDTTKNDVTNAFTARQTITATDNSNAPLIITQGGTGEVLRLKNSSNTTPVLSLEHSDTTILSGDVYGSIQFLGNDASTNATGLQAKIEASSRGATGGADLDFYATGSTDRTPYRLARATINSFATGGLGYFDIEEIRCNYINNQIHLFGQVDMINTDTTIDVDLTAYVLNDTNYMAATVAGLYNNGAGTYARLHKRWDQTVFNNGTTYTIAGAALNSSYNSDATNFPAGAVNAAKVASVGSASAFVLRFTNRTTPAAASTTTFRWNVIITGA